MAIFNLKSQNVSNAFQHTIMLFYASIQQLLLYLYSKHLSLVTFCCGAAGM